MCTFYTVKELKYGYVPPRYDNTAPRPTCTPCDGSATETHASIAASAGNLALISAARAGLPATTTKRSDEVNRSAAARSSAGRSTASALSLATRACFGRGARISN